jgi:ribose transport system ATP-binding protein
MNPYRLEMKNISKTFAASKALSDVEFHLKPGEAQALLGMNGAGKSTLIKILSGVYTKDSGQIFINGDEVVIENTKDSMDRGIATVYQSPMLVQSFTGYESIYLGFESKNSSLFSKIDRTALRKNAEMLANEYGININVSKIIADMKPVERELICILNALSKRSKILILDEPTSILSKNEKDMLFRVIASLKSKDVSIIFVTHRLDEVNEICDEITVLRDGKNVDTLRIGSGLDPSFIAELMLGKKLEKMYPQKAEGNAGEVGLSTAGFCRQKRFSGININARKNEILGIFGLVGSGIDELSKTLFGAIGSTDGTMSVAGKHIKLSSPEDAIRHGIFLVPGDRQTEGYIAEQSIATNLTISNIKKISSAFLGCIRKIKKKQDAVDMMNKLKIAAASERKAVSELSGGNQQKVVVGKGLYTDAMVYIFCEPTVGVDVGARNSIYEIMRRLSKDSVVILISSDIEEVFGVSDRIIVMNQGKITSEAAVTDISMNEMLVNAVSVTN